MCGIAGIWNFSKKAEWQHITTFTDTMAHRGPDGAGYHIFEDSNLALGHRRLSILDLSEDGKQPMHLNNSNFWITYNGEIYNFLEIKKELHAEGIQFKSSSDTEVILAAYKKWGKDCLNKFNGMFAFAIYDEVKKELFIARDRYGVKPLHYLYIPNKIFAFASETIAFKKLQDFDRTINTANFIYSIQLPGVLEPKGESIFNDIKQLKAGHYGHITTKDIKINQWYNLASNLTTVTQNYTEQVEQFKDLFFDACKLRLRSDVSVASALSGGIDSSSVFCTIQQLAKQNFSNERLPSKWQQAFSISFPGSELDEVKYVKLIQQQTNADVKIIENNQPNLVKDIINSTVLFDNIIGTPIIAVTDVYKAMKQNNITVSLDGHAGDELLFGYRSAVYEVLFEAHLNDELDKNELAELYVLMTHGTASTQEVNDLNTKVAAIAANFKPSLKNSIKFFLKRNKQDIQYPIPCKIKGHANKRLFEQFQYTDLPHVLRDFDRASMQHGIEIRSPLLDYRLVEYVWSLPLSSKIGGGFTKKILRDAMKGIVPNEILQRKTKIGLAAPTANWLNTSLSQFILDTVNSKSFLTSPYWDGNKLSIEYIKLTTTKSWTPEKATKAWCIINAHLIS